MRAKSTPWMMRIDAMFSAGPARVRVGNSYSWYGCPGDDVTGTWYYATTLHVRQGDLRSRFRVVGKPLDAPLDFAGREISIPGWTVRPGQLTAADGWVDGVLTAADADYLDRLSAEWAGYDVDADMPSNPRDGNFCGRRAYV
jgi:hypothetical protein